MPADFEEEALKAQAVAARTYLYSHIAEKDKGNIAESHQRCGDMHRFNALSGVYFGG